MPSHHYDHHHKDGYELAHHIRRDLRHSHRPTRFIVNEGKLIIDERSFDDRDRSSSSRSNTVIYNAPGSTMWIESKSGTTECRGCFRRRDRLYGGYCSGCATLRLDTPRRHEVVTVDNRRLLEYPEKRAIGWR
ncbi:hypothetical protein E0Z10_g6456 [Xylaria hypoxylon]|uniref:Uncharacterized protein n=1 Tax=Xylaria hypoxylon TaxID=37992 RepID=A0A4Z0YY52_9PEZI|nr:hypothetical protein E0Z10_g6456 [Xylaria hypoxylon]